MLEPDYHPHGMNALDLPGFGDDDMDSLFDGEENVEPPTTGGHWWRRKRWVALCAAALAVIVLGGVAAVVNSRGTVPVTYQTQAVAQGNLSTTISATGPLQGGIYNVSFSGSGKIAEIDVAVGQQVTAGQLLAKLDPTSLQDAVNAAQASVNGAQTSLNNAESSAGKSQTQNQAGLNVAYASEQAALAKCASGDSTCTNQAETQYAQAQAQASASNATAQSQINSAQSQLNGAQTQLQTAQHNLSTAVLTAPHAGTVASINGTVGGTPGAGASATSAFIEIADLSSLQVEADVNEADIGNVAAGQSARFTVSAYTARQFRGTVSSVSPIGQTTSNVVTYPVTVDVDMSSLQGARLFSGMTASVTITTASRAGVLLVPASAVTYARTAAGSGTVSRTALVAAIQQARQLLQALPSADAQDNPAASYVLERANGTWSAKPVVLGLTNGTYDEVLAGLSQGESVVVGQTGGATTSASTGSSLVPGGGRGGFGGGGGNFGGGRGGAGGSTGGGSNG